MLAFKFDEIVFVAKNGTRQQWEEVLLFLKNYCGEEEEILGLQVFVNDNVPNERAALINFTNEISEATPFRTKRNKLIRMPNWVMTMAATLLLVSGLVINHYFHKKSLHLTEEALPVFLSSEDEVMNKAMAQYKKGDYKAAVINFEKLNSDTSSYYAGVCYELTNNYESGITKFNEVSENSAFYVKAKIRMAAIYLALDNNKEAKAVIHNLTPNNDNEASRLKSIKIRLY